MGFIEISKYGNPLVATKRVFEIEIVLSGSICESQQQHKVVMA